MKKSMSQVVHLLRLGYKDTKRSVILWRYWLYRSIIRINLKYKESWLGIVWPSMSLVFITLALGTVWGVILERAELTFYFAYLAGGFPVWQTISGSVASGTKSFSREIVVANIPLSSSIFEKWSEGLLNLAYILPVALLLPLAVGSSSIGNLLLVVPAIICIAMWSWGVIAAISVASLLRPDIKHVIGSIMRVMFLATPVIWEPSRLGDYQEYLWLNPFYPVLELVRYALTGILHDTRILLITPLYSIAVLATGFIVLSRYINIVRLRVA